jgi:hypothetical protein
MKLIYILPDDGKTYYIGLRRDNQDNYFWNDSTEANYFHWWQQSGDDRRNSYYKIRSGNRRGPGELLNSWRSVY